MIGRILISLLAVFHWACELPFETKPTDKDELFTVTHDYDGRRIVRATPVLIQWSKITIENFKEFLIERAYINEDGPQWAIVGRVADSLATSYADTLWDDVTHQYRVRMVDKNNQYLHDLTAPFVVPEVTSIIVPDNYTSIQEPYDTKFIDSGDTVFVLPGGYQDNFTFTNKDVVIKGVQGPERTVLVALHVGVTELEGHLPIDRKYYSPSVVEISRGILDGFTITGGVALYGGGVKALGNAKITNCIITENELIEHPNPRGQEHPVGHGAGVYASDSARVHKSTISWNRRGDGITVDGTASVINGTISNNSRGGLVIAGQSNIVRNNRIIRNGVWGNYFGVAIESANAVILNTIIVYNSRRGNGGRAIRSGHGTSTILNNSVIYANTSGNLDEGPFVINGEIQILNSIIRTNSGEIDRKLFIMSASYSNIEGLDSWLSSGNIDSDPRFVDAESGDFHLLPDSPGIDAGHPGDEYRDVDGSRNDMGIYGGPYGNAW